jgi:hypothetical protein
MKKDTIETNDLKFRENLQELRARLVSRRQSNQPKDNPHILIKVIIPLVLVILGVTYFTAQKIYRKQAVPVSKQMQPSESKPLAPSKLHQAKQTRPSEVVPEIEATGVSHGQKQLSAGSGKSSLKPEKELTVSNDKTVESQVSINPIKNSKTERKPGQKFLSKTTNEATLKLSKEEQTGLAPELRKSPVLYHFEISRTVICEDVKSLTAVAPQSVFSLRKHRQAYVWMEVHSETVPYTLRHVYYHEGQKYCEVPLRIKFPRMRTWSNITLKNPNFIGSWRVDIVTEEEAILVQKTFEVIAGD